MPQASHLLDDFLDIFGHCNMSDGAQVPCDIFKHVSHLSDT